MRSSLCLTLFAFGIAATLARAADAELLDRIAAVVDDEAILLSELNERLERSLGQQMRFVPSEEELARLREQTLEAMIDEHVVVLKAQKDSIQVDNTRVEELLNEQYARMKSRVDADDFMDGLERSGLSERQLKARYRKDIRHGLLFDQMRQELAYRLHITHRDVADYRAAHRDTLPPVVFLSQINVKVKPTPETLAEVDRRVREIEQKLADGEEFADLARTYSEDSNTAPDGGSLGCFEAGSMLPEFEYAAFELKPGQVSEPVLTRIGYHLILLREKREDELCASHILLRAPVTDQDKERALDQLRELRERALVGEEFGQLARTHSDDKESAAQGGLWRMFAKDQIPVFLQAYIGHLKLGGVSEPFFLEDGGHIVRVNDDYATLERLMREDRLVGSIRQVIEDYRPQLNIERRLDEPAGAAP